MFNIFKKKTFYIRVYENRIVIRFIEENKTLDRISTIPFSNKRMALADFNIFEKLLVNLIKEITPNKNIFTSIRILFQVMEKIEDGLCDLETRAYKDSGIFINGKIIKIYTRTDLLSDNKVLEIINSKNGQPFVKQ